MAFNYKKHNPTRTQTNQEIEQRRMLDLSILRIAYRDGRIIQDQPTICKANNWRKRLIRILEEIPDDSPDAKLKTLQIKIKAEKESFRYDIIIERKD